MLILSLVALAQAVVADDNLASGNLAEALYYASADAAGTYLCDRRRSARYKRQFKRRYGERIRELQKYHEARFGPDPNFIVVTGCRMPSESGRQQDREHARALDEFETRFRELEAKYGPPEDHR